MGWNHCIIMESFDFFFFWDTVALLGLCSLRVSWYMVGNICFYTENWDCLGFQNDPGMIFVFLG